MKVVIPMAGVGQRFKDLGYAAPKPLIRLGDGRMIVEHVLDMFDRDNDEFVFVVNATHAEEENIGVELAQLVNGCVVEVMPDHKLGPVHTLTAAFKHVRPNEEVIVAYCDGKVDWDYAAFKRWLKAARPHGCLVTHSGFHPHTLSSTKMAFVRVEDGCRVVQVQEKQSFTNDPFSEHASSGVYYFKRGGDLKKYAEAYLRDGDSFRGEYYVTLLYNLMIAAGGTVRFYDTDYVAILGTPHEVRLFDAWQTIAEDGFIKSSTDAAKCYDYWKGYASADENRQNTILP